MPRLDLEALAAPNVCFAWRPVAGRYYSRSAPGFNVVNATDGTNVWHTAQGPEGQGAGHGGGAPAGPARNHIHVTLKVDPAVVAAAINDLLVAKPKFGPA